MELSNHLEDGPRRRPTGENGTRRSVEAQVHALGPWQQNLHLPDGTQTAPDEARGNQARREWEAILPHLPADLDAWRILDIGCNAGFFSIRFAQRGARVTAMDVDGHSLSQARWAAAQFGVTGHVEFRRNMVYGLANEREQFDLIWCMGTIDGLRYPLFALDVLKRITRRLLVVQTATAHGALEDAGFIVRASPMRNVLVCEPRPNEPEWTRLSRESELQAVLSVGGDLDD